jgi:hypothetical protein
MALDFFRFLLILGSRPFGGGFAEQTSVGSGRL